MATTPQPLINVTVTTPAAPSATAAKALTVHKAKGLATLGYNTLKKVYNDGVTLITANEYGLSAADATAALDAGLIGGSAAFFALGQVAANAVNAAVPGTIPAPTASTTPTTPTSTPATTTPVVPVVPVTTTPVTQPIVTPTTVS